MERNYNVYLEIHENNDKESHKKVDLSSKKFGGLMRYGVWLDTS